MALLVCWKKAQSFTHPPAKHKRREPFVSEILPAPRAPAATLKVLAQHGTNASSSLPPWERGRPGSKLGLKGARRLR